MVFKIIQFDSSSSARLGILKTMHGKIETPFFMPVQTKGTAKFLNQKELREIGIKAIICNALLLSLKPGIKIIKKFGSIHDFIGWNKIIFTDSGGFQVLRREFLIKLYSTGILFRNPFNGEKIFLTPQKAIKIQNTLNSDVIMCLDDVPSIEKSKKTVANSVKNTIEWAKTCLKEHENKKQLLFGITQGSVFPDLRKKCTIALNSLNFDGIAIGGLSIGEKEKQRNKIIMLSNKLISKEKPRYLMGVGSIKDIIKSVANGMDFFDSAFPTRMARHGIAFTFKKDLNILKKQFKNDEKPLEKNCNCMVCQNFSRAYIHHLFKVKEPNGLHYLSHHNIALIEQLMKKIRNALKENSFKQLIKKIV
jgi:queuine tRNA-ribosyltransferase